MKHEHLLAEHLQRMRHDIKDLQAQETNRGGILNVRDFGAKPDAHRVRDAAMTAGSAILTSTSGLFAKSDRGLVIGVAGAGATGVPLITTIASYQSATQVTLAAPASTTVSGKIASWGTDNTTAFQAALDAAAALPGSTSYSNRTTGVGGGVVFVPDGSYLCGSLLLANRAGLRGASERATLYMLPGMSTALISNPAFAQRIVLDTLSVIGNRELQITAVDGIYLHGLTAAEGGVIDYTLQEEADMRPVVSNIYMDHMPGNGIHLEGRGDTQLRGCRVYRTAKHGYVINMDDAYVTDCIAAMTEGAGFYIARGGGHYVSIKAWYCGGVPNSPLYLKDLTGANILDAFSNPIPAPGVYLGGAYGGEMAGVEVQDAHGPGIYSNGARRWVITGFHADSCGRATGTAEPGVVLHNSEDIRVDGTIGYRFLNDDGTFSYAQNQTDSALLLTGSSINNQVSLGSYNLKSAPLDAASTAVIGNAISLGNQDGVQNLTSFIPLATGAQTLLSSTTPLTPNPALGRAISITLANNIVLNAPSSAAYGDILTITMTQDATGGRTVVWDAIYTNTSQPTAAANAVTEFRLIYDGANWRVWITGTAGAAWRPVDPYSGGTVIVSLQNNVELAAPTPSHTGMRLTFIFTQNGGVAHTVTWNVAYQTSWQPTAALLSKSTLSFVYDGAKWLPDSAEVGTAPTLHAASHTAGGSDPITVADAQLSSNVALKDVGNVFTQTQTISKTAGNAFIALDSVAATFRAFVFYTAGSQRWLFGANATAESGANAGSDFGVIAYNDAGAAIGFPLVMRRSTSSIMVGSSTLPHTRLQVAGPIATAFVAKTAAYVLTATDSIVSADASGAAFTLTLPTAVGIAGRQYTVKRTNSGVNNVTIACTGAETIDGAATYVLTAQWQAVRLVSNGAGWLVV